MVLRYRSASLLILFCGLLSPEFLRPGFNPRKQPTSRLFRNRCGSSSKGQVVIPEDVRDDLGLHEGDQFVVIGQGDAVILKVMTPPKIEEFQELLSQARAEAKKARVKKADLKSAIARVRRRAK